VSLFILLLPPAAFDYEATREAAMAAFAKSWRRDSHPLSHRYAKKAAKVWWRIGQVARAKKEHA